MAKLHFKTLKKRWKALYCCVVFCGHTKNVASDTPFVKTSCRPTVVYCSIQPAVDLSKMVFGTAA